MNDTMKNIELEKRIALPDALRVLMEEFPRNSWESNVQFDGLISFWLDKHMMFRRLMQAMITDSQQMIEGNLDAQQFQTKLSRYGGNFVSGLHGHHQIEDAHYFPVLEKMDTRLVRGFKILDEDHHALDRHLENFTKSANSVLQQNPISKDNQFVGDLNEALLEFDKLLDRHLVDEEELVVPVLLKYGMQGLA